MSTKRKKTKRNSIVTVLGLLVLLVVVGFELVQVYGKLSSARAEEAALSLQSQQKQQENEALRSDLEKSDDPEFIIGLAKDQLGLVEEGERIFYDVNH